MLAFVVNKQGQPLMPCSPSKARKLLQAKKARVVDKSIFTIKLIHGSSGYKQEVVAGMDTGSKVIGTAAISSGKVLYQAETMLRAPEISKKMQQRHSYRRTRRGRKTRYRAPRFLNRAASTRAGRLAPSVQHKLAAHLREKKHLESILPVTSWRVETAAFDIHKITDPSIIKKPGSAYQQGAKKDFYNTKAYILHRDYHTCQKCKKNKDGLPLQVHHIVFCSHGGTDTPNNLVTLCKPCHDKLHKHKAAEKESLKLQKVATAHTKHATEVSILKSQLKKCFGTFYETFGYVTKFDREQLGLPKTHYYDAVCIAAENQPLSSLSRHYYVRRCVSKGDYQQTKGANSEKKIPTKKLFGLRKFDLVKTEKGTGFVKGKRSTGYFSISNIYGIAIHNSVNVKQMSTRIAARKSIIIGREKAQEDFAATQRLSSSGFSIPPLPKARGFLEKNR